MAKVSNSFTTYDAKANREDLSNSIYNIDPMDSPVVSMIGRRSVSNRTFDWQTEKLPNVDITAREEGFELQRSLSTPTVRVKNVAQINSRDATVSGSQESADPAGKKSELAHQMALVSKALKRDVEVALCSTQALDYGTTASPVRKTRGLMHWLATNVDAPAGTVLPATETAAYPVIAAGSLREFTEDMLGNAMQKAYDNGAEPNTLICRPDLKRQVSGFKGRDISQVMVGKTEVSNVVDIYASDFGRLKVVPSRWMPLNTVLLLDPEYAAMANYRSFQQKEMARIGDAETRMLLVEWGVEMKNEAAHAAIIGVKAKSTITPSTVAVPLEEAVPAAAAK